MVEPQHPQWRQPPGGGWEYLAPDGRWHSAGPAPYYGGPPVPRAAAPGNGQAVAALVLGITCVVFCWWGVFALAQIVLAFVFGGVGLSKANRGAGGKGMAVAGIVLGCVGFLLYAVVGILTFGALLIV